LERLAQDGKKEQNVVKEVCWLFLALAACSRNLSLTWRTIRKRKI